MDENKEVVVQNLETLLRSTRVITYDNRDYEEKVNVTADSGLAIIKDIMRKL